MSLFYRGNGVYSDKPANKVKHQHGLSKTDAHRSWIAMMQRCCNKNSSGYRRYGGAGITVCERWRDFVAFYADMGERPKGCTLERRDPKGPYDAANCRWATAIEQARNRAVTKFVTVDGGRQPLSAVAATSGLDYHMLYKRLRRGHGDRLLEKSGALFGEHIKGISKSPEHKAKISAAVRAFHERRRATNGHR